MLKFNAIPRYELYYAVSRTGIVLSKRTGLYLKPSKAYNYPVVALSVNKVRTFFSVAELVALVYLPNPYNYKYVKHISGDMHDCSVENLRYVRNKP